MPYSAPGKTEKQPHQSLGRGHPRHACGSFLGLDQANHVETYDGLPGPLVFAVPDVDALEDAPAAREVDDASSAAVGSSVAQLNLFR